MKPNFKSLLILSFFALLFVTSCQNEFIEESEQNEEETLVPNSVLTSMMRSTVTNDGAIDDLLDESSCFSVNLPVTISVNGITVTIDSLEDIEVIEDIYDEFDDDEDGLEFLFPITILLNDYEQIVIESEDALEAFIEECTEDIEDTIECVDFVYPITMSIYNSSFQVIENVSFSDDEEMYDFLEDLEDDTNDQVIIASLNFPVSLIYADGTIIEVNNNEELQAAINAAEDDCYDDEYNCSVEEVEMYLMECYWTINDYPETDDLDNLYLNFGPNGDLSIIDGATTVAIGGSWDMSTSNDGLPEIVISDLTAYDFLEGSWIVVECDDDEFIIEYETVAGEEIQFELEQECEDDLDCSAQELIETLKECKWWMGTNLLSPNYSGPLFFNDDNVLLVGQPNSNQLQGTWEVALTDNGIFMFLTVGGDYEVIALDWTLIDCDDDRLEFISGDSSLVLEQECEDEYDCEAEEIISDLVECVWFGETSLYDTFAPEVFTFHENGTVSTQSSDLESIGTWSVVTTGQNVNIIFDFIEEPYSQMSTEWLVIECDDDRVKGVNGDDYVLFEQDCDQNTGPLGCLEASAIVMCDENNDGFETFNLYEGLSDIDDCEINGSVSVSYHETLPDAEANLNSLTGVTAYTNITNPQTIYVRVEVTNNPNEFEVLEIDLILENCSDDCTEMDVDEYLTECYWQISSYNGSDDLSIFNLYFDDSGTVTIIGDSQTITSTWSTYGSENGVVVNFNQVGGSNIQVITGDWLVLECGEEAFHLQRESDNMILEQQVCYSEDEIEENLIACTWEVMEHMVNGNDVAANYDGIEIVFYESGDMVGEGNAEYTMGFWSVDDVGLTDNALFIDIPSPLFGITNYWQVVAIGNTQIILNASNGAGGVDTLTLQTLSCDENPATDGDVDYINNSVQQGLWEVTQFIDDGTDETSDYTGRTFDFEDDNVVVGSDGNTDIDFFYDTLRDSNNDLRFLINMFGQLPYVYLGADWYVTDITATRIELHLTSNANDMQNVLVFEKIIN